MSKITRHDATQLIHDYVQQQTRYHIPVAALNDSEYPLRLLHDSIANGRGPLSPLERGQAQVVKHYHELLLGKKATGHPQDLRAHATRCTLECQAALTLLGEDASLNVAKAIKGARRRSEDDREAEFLAMTAEAQPPSRQASVA